MKPALPHQIVALACKLPSCSDISTLVQEHFSPLASCTTDTTNTISAAATLIHTAQEALLDSGLKHIPRNTAVFVSMPAEWLQSNEISRTLHDHFQRNHSSDLTIMLYADSRESISEAINWLDRSECELALVLALDNIGSENAAAGLLIVNNTAARSNRLRAFASIEQGIADASISLIEWCGDASNLVQTLSKASDKPTSSEIRELSSEWTQHDSVRYVSSLALSLAGSSAQLAPVLALVSAALSLQLRVLPSSQLDLRLDKSGDFVQILEPRPWIHPVSPIEPAHPRKALVSDANLSLVLSEAGNDIETINPNRLQQQSSELFIFSGKTIAELIEDLSKLRFCDEALDDSVQRLSLCELAYLNNILRQSISRNLSESPYLLAIIASTKEELAEHIETAVAHLNSAPGSPLMPLPGPNGIYFNGKPAAKPGKLAFLFPGLGAAYPQMLQDLCFYYPEVRQVFDFVERMALRAGDKIIPSRTIFPVAGAKQAGSSQAMLATMDSAVVSLLLAEWAIFALLKKLGVVADLFIGCSTGEFAALCMSDAINTLEAAETFYRLSTEVSRSVSLKSLSQLRSVRVAASYDKTLAPILDDLAESMKQAGDAATIYLGADLSESCVLLSGPKASIEELCTRLRQQKIDYLMLPIPIPYHTPLVSGKISHKDAAVQALRMTAPQVEAWSCSSSDLYPCDAASLRKISIDLFEKPIQLRSTLLKCYESGSRIFLEVGPKGGLVPFISEVLQGKEHLAIAANLQGRTGIDQFHVMLAQLACHGVDLDLQFLYKRRIDSSQALSGVKLQPGQASQPETSESLQISDSLYEFMESPFNPQQMLDLQALMHQDGPFNLHSMMNPEALLSGGAGAGIDPSHFGLDWNLFSESGLSNEVMLTYLSTMQQFHASLMNTQERLMLAYIQAAEEEATNREFESVAIPGDYAFLPNPAIQSYEDCFQVEFSLSTYRQPFLLDHAIGGDTKSAAQSKVYLLPLMVALEIMAEGASLVFPALKISRLSDIRAYKRIRVEERDLQLFLELRVVRDNCVEARICLAHGEPDDSTLLASCLVEFTCERLPGPTPWQFSFKDAHASQLSPARLYERGSMFHGPRMQSVKSIDRVCKRQIEGKLDCRIAQDWFAGQPSHEVPRLVINPLLIDNASQFVLYQMYEHDLPAVALLPFHIDSIEFFAGFDEQFGSTVQARAQLFSMNTRGTEAKVELQDQNGTVIARVNDVSSRAIILPDRLNEFVHDPAYLLCQQILPSQSSTQAIIASISKTEMPEDETTLDWLSDYLLCKTEQSEWRKIGRSAKRRLDWLSGRIAAKDALRLYLKKYFNIEAKPADIEIRASAAGYAEILSYPGIELTGSKIQISISHCQSMAVAIAESIQLDRLAGIDVEDIVEREAGFTELSFSIAERKWLASKPKEEEARYIGLLWSAKEASAKACGTGFLGNPKSFELLSESEDIFKIVSRLEGVKPRIFSCRVYTDQNRQLTFAYVFDSQEPEQSA